MTTTSHAQTPLAHNTKALGGEGLQQGCNLQRGLSIWKSNIYAEVMDGA